MRVIKQLLKKQQQKKKFQQQLALIRQSDYFDASFYLEQYPDVAAAGLDAAEHFLKYGANELRQPSPRFDTAFYLQQYPDVATSALNPLIHFLRFGSREGRQPNQDQSQRTSLAEVEQQLQLQISMDPNNPDLFDELALVLQRQGKYWQEVQALQASLKLDSQSALRHYRLGQALDVMQKFHESADAYQQATELDPSQPEWFFRLGFALQRSQADTLTVQQAFQKAMELDQTLQSHQFGIGAFHQQQANWQEAIACYQDRLAQRPKDAELLYRLGYAYDRLYNWAKAEDYYCQALAKMDNVDWYFRLGFVLERQKKFSQAAVAYQFAAKNRQRHTPYWHYRCGYVLLQAGEYQAACQAFLNVSVAPELFQSAEFVADEAAMALHDRLLTLQKTHWQNEQKRLQKVLKKDCTLADDWYALGNAYEYQQAWSDARDAYQQALKRCNQYNPNWYFRLGFVRYKLGFFQQAADAFSHSHPVRQAHGVSEKPLNGSAALQLRYAEYYETLPLQSNTILFESFSGKSISCNPYALFLEMQADPRYQSWEFIWVIDSIDKVPLNLRNKLNVSFIERGSDRYLRAIAESAYLVNNSGFPPYYVRKEGQRYLATWHGTPLKTLGKEQKYKFFDHKRTQRNFLQSTHIISPNKHTTDILFDSYDIRRIYQGKLAETGYPRIDLTLNQNPQSVLELKKALGILDERPIVLYAPTWRGTLQEVEFDTRRLEQDIARMASLGGHVLFRGHSLLEQCLAEVKLGCTVVPAHIDSNALLSVVDILITDYSSIFFDFIPLKRPIIYYAYDLEEYQTERGLYFEMTQMPGRVCSTMDEVQAELMACLSAQTTGLHGAEAAMQRFNHHDDGKASARVLQLFLDDDNSYVVAPNTDQSIGNMLIFPGGMIPNGITTSFINLIRALSSEKIHPVIIFSPGNIEFNADCREQFDRIGYQHDFVPRFGNVLMTLEERAIRSYADQRRYHDISPEQHEVLDRMYAREYLRLLGHARIDRIVHFSGYDEFWTKVFASVANTQKSIYLHNDLYAEHTERFPFLQVNFSLYHKYDQLVSVSELTSELNKNNLAPRYQLPDDRFIFCNNLQNPADVQSRAAEPLLAADQELFQQNKTTFITMGRLSIEKDHSKLIRAFAQLQKANPSTQLLILGDGPLKVQLNQLVQSLNLSHAVHLLGQRTNPFPLLQAADCFVLSSNHEGQPMVLFEAMILKKPIISTDIVGSRSAIEGRSGCLVENSVQGLTVAMQRFCVGQLETSEYDISSYQRESLAMFYEKVCQLKG
ncbi:CDP-glycerol glycerophosphotransferase family protein [Alkalimonas sp.]|uniref:CDP-glycerol glycerophosphotransferase family protein n=1 Tax=Alkalimonas sp. TaxID=1872453 RepID=UPI00263B615E|nr:CDP-glycerol glycerophosphotransferase family protein [Alkalimonas sp.]MCC5824601.1 CDP-glycerol glycerophosphotransferase family protein [Alkalimonas sp.]